MSSFKKRDMQFKFLSFLVIVLVFQTGCIHLTTVNCSTVKERIVDEAVLAKKTFLELKNGNKIYGTKLKTPLFRDVTSIDGKEFKNEEVRGYSMGGHYYLYFNNKEFLRLVEGYVSVYKMTEVTTGSGFNTTSTRSVCNIYAKKGPDGVLTVIRFLNELKAFVKDCDAAYAMVDKSSNEVSKLLKKDRLYLNKVFETYNSNCK